MKSLAESYGGYSPDIFKLVPAGARVLDAGCSTGELAKKLSTEKDCDVVGIDMDVESLERAKKFCSQVYRCDLDNSQALTNHLTGKTFEVICLGDILEHLRDPWAFLETVSSFLERGGLVIASIPNAGFIGMRIRFLFNKLDYQDRGGLFDKWHLRFFNFRTARKLFVISGYRVRKIFGTAVVKKRFWILKMLSRFCPSLFALHIIVVAEKS